MCTRGTIEAEQLPHFFAGFNATRSTAGLYSFLQRSLPQEYQQMLASFVNMGTKSRVMNFVGSVSQDWERKSLNKSSSLRSSSTRSNDPEDDDITLVIGGCSFRVCPSLPLKSVFNEYADNNSVSLKSLRFSYAGKTLFLSTAGRKSPNELGMLDNDMIEVHNSVQETTVPSTGDNDKQNTNQQSKKKKQKKSKKTKTKSKNGSYKIEIVKSDEEHKEKHSKILTKLFEEADPKFKMIRQQLNAQNLFKQQPKTKTLKNLKQQDYCYHYSSVNPGVGGKAGKTRFLVNVGEVAHLYKSSKSVASSTTSTIDLHGCTQEEAISKLDAGLKEWNERAMLGSYPFVHLVSIVCGAGGQVLSETVEKWIGKQPNVANVPKASKRYATAA
jgi:DNA-nicking Smr family endonuclease